MDKQNTKQEQHTLSSRINDVRVHIEHGKQHDEAMKRITAKQEQVKKPFYKVEGPLHVVCQCDKCKAKQEQGEPVAWMRSEGVGSPIVTEELCQKHPEYRLFFTVPLYTTPQPAQKPLTDEQIEGIAQMTCIGISPHEDTINFVKAIEAAHGIKENT